MKSLKFEFDLLIKALFLAGLTVAANHQPLHAQDNWEQEFQWDDETPPGEFSPEDFIRAQVDAADARELPSLKELESLLGRNLGGDFPLRVKALIKNIRRGKDPRLNLFSPDGSDDNEYEARRNYEILKRHLEDEKGERDSRKRKGIIEVGPDKKLRLSVLSGFDRVPIDELSKAVEKASGIAGADIGLSPEEAASIKEELKRVTETALHITATEIDDEKLKGISKLSPSERFLIHMDRDRFQNPSKKNRDQMKEEGRLAELDGMLHGEFTGIEKTPIVRMVLPNRQEAFLILDTSYTDQYSPHMLMLIARQLQRARNGLGRPVVILLYTPAKNGEQAKIHAEVLTKPKKFSDSAFATRTAAMMPPTKNEVAWSAVYTGYMILCWYFTKVTANWSQVPEAPSATLEDFLRFAGEIGSFFSKYSTGIESHVFYSALIGLCYSAYTYLIFDKNIKAWMQTLRHLVFISMPAGLYTLAMVNNWGLDELFLTGAGMMAVTHTLINALVNNVSRAFSHSVFSARDGHRVGMGEIPFLGFKFKRQQFYRELLTFPLLFMTKIAHLMKLQPDVWIVRGPNGERLGYSTPLIQDIPWIGEYLNLFSLGELSFYTFPIVAFAGALIYFLLKDDGVNYSEDRRKLVSDAWAFLKAPVIVPYKVARWGCRQMLWKLTPNPVKPESVK